MNHTSNKYLLGIDPGTNTGISVIGLDNEFNLESITTYTFNLNDYIDESLPTIEREADRLIMLEKILNNILAEYNPIAVAMENAFFNKKFPLSGLKLSAFIGVITMTIRKHSRDIPIYKLQPKYIKSVVSTGDAYKDDMKKAIENLEEVNNFININNETEHSIDAIAISYSLYNIIKERPYVLCT